jgi:hypothetical protein
MRYGLIACRLTIDASADPRQRGTTALGYGVTAIVAVFGAWARGHSGACARDGIFDAVIDLILYRAIACPAACHDAAFLHVGRCRTGVIVGNLYIAM